MFLSSPNDNIGGDWEASATYAEFLLHVSSTYSCCLAAPSPMREPRLAMISGVLEDALAVIVIAAAVNGRSGLAEVIGLEGSERGLIKLSLVTTILMYTSPKEEQASFLSK